MLTPPESLWVRLLVQFIGMAVTRTPRPGMWQATLQFMLLFIRGHIMCAMCLCMSTIGLSLTCGIAALVGRRLQRLTFM